MPTADTILTNANIITVDLEQPAAQLVAVKSGKIVFTGSRDRLADWRGVGTRVVDCAGKTLVPGFNDAHCHIFSFIRKLLSVDLSSPAVKSITDIKTAIKQKAQNTPPGEWIQGTDYNEFMLREKRHPTRWELDEVAPAHPVVISHRSLHACVLNSRALTLAGINTESPEPPGARIGRDIHTGEPDGLLVEMLGFIREQVMPPISGDELDRGVRLADEQYLAQGLTSLQDATYVNDLKRWHHYEHFKAGNRLKSRVYMMAGTETVKEFQAAGMEFGWGDEQLRLGAVKIVPSLVSGQLYPPQPVLQELVLNAHRAGFQVAIHAVQEKLLEAIIGIYEYVKEQAPDFGKRRHRIEHCAECTPGLQERIQRLGVLVTTHPSFAYYSGDRYLATVSPDIIPYLYPIKSLVDRGLVVAGASDSPVVPNNPLMGIYGGVTRQTSSGQRMTPEQCVTARQVLAFYTINAAYNSFEEQMKGSITTGKLADMVLLSADPTTVAPEQIKDINVEMAMIDGRIVWES